MNMEEKNDFKELALLVSVKCMRKTENNTENIAHNFI